MGTITRAFGVSSREGHCSKKFYSSQKYKNKKLPSNTVAHEEKIDDRQLDKIYHASSENMFQLPSNSVHLMVTSPPYNVGKEYDNDLTIEEYRDMLSTVWREVYRVLIVGGRACVNIANIGRKPYIPLSSFIVTDMLNAGFLMRGEIIWNKAASAGTSTAWGSWCSPSNPVLRDIHEYILVFCKDKFNRKINGAAESKEPTITKQQFLDYTKSIWNFPSESAKKVGHAAPFPIELPHRFIQLYTYTNDIVLDPFMGSGTTAIAAKRSGRNFIGYDTEEKYVQLARKRIADYYPLLE